MNSDKIGVNSADIASVMGDLTQLEGDITALSGSIGSASSGFKDAVGSATIAGSNPGREVYNDAASIIFGAGKDSLPQLKSLKCWGDMMAVIGYELEYTDGVIYKRMGTAALPAMPVTLDFASGEYINQIAGTTETMVNSLTFTKNDGTAITCGNASEGFAFAPITGTYLIGIDGKFSEYLDATQMKTMPESAAQAFLP